MSFLRYLVTLVAWTRADRDLRASAEAAEEAWHKFELLSGSITNRTPTWRLRQLPRTFRDLAALQIDPDRKKRAGDAARIVEYMLTAGY